MNSASSLTPIQPDLEASFVDRRQQLGTGDQGEREGSSEILITNSRPRGGNWQKRSMLTKSTITAGILQPMNCSGY